MIVFGCPIPSSAPVPMPKAPMDKYNFSQPWKNKVRSSRQILAVKTKSISQAMRQTTYRHFWLGVG
jgi:hypothetical protein